MTGRPRRNHSPASKAKVALAAIRGEQTLVELSQQFDIHANQIKQRKDQLLEGATLIMSAKLHNIDPQAWLADVLARVADTPVSRLEQLLPWNWTRAEAPMALIS